MGKKKEGGRQASASTRDLTKVVVPPQPAGQPRTRRRGKRKIKKRGARRRLALAIEQYRWRRPDEPAALDLFGAYSVCRILTRFVGDRAWYAAIVGIAVDHERLIRD